ncbi:DUF4123 domain-containing protein [Burkholderia diffusa]|uniref:DUF4123 domain-containing protein n=1 Tax=Burkholderia diffusa TaxID=488732 RepID=UPI0026571375|nr:DUF4123 domain-containing protein [Burkholderia diffusa]MDN7903605.1 DUF4123 domain-containing protein [Burkholderia diffusa]
MEPHTIDAGWPRQVVRATAEPAWSALQSGPRPWLLLSGAHSEALEEEVIATIHGFDYRWVWRDTPLEYALPGYRHGPLLVPLDAALLAHAVATWIPQQAGVILLGPNDESVLVSHVQGLHQFIAADGWPVAFGLHITRALEECCEALPEDQRAQLFGPIEACIWHDGETQTDTWLRADAPDRKAPPLSIDHHLALTPSDEAALNLAGRAWFMREFAHTLTRRFPAYAPADAQLALRRSLATFADEAHQFGFRLECDIRYYMELRLRYPREPFVEDKTVHALLNRREDHGMSRLFAITARLTQIASLTF